MFRDNKNGYFMFLPPKGWTTQEYGDPRTKVQFNHPKDDGVLIRFIVREAPGETYDSMINEDRETASQMKNRGISCEVTEREVHGLKCSEVAAQFPDDGGTLMLRKFLSRGLHFNIQYGAPTKSLFQKYHDEAVKSLDTITVLKTGDNDPNKAKEQQIASRIRLAKLTAEWVSVEEARQVLEEARKEFPDSELIQDALKAVGVLTEAPGLPTVQTDTYTVQPTDTLFYIALKELDSGERWKEIYALNRDLIGDNLLNIHIGQVLKMPPRDARGGLLRKGKQDPTPKEPVASSRRVDAADKRSKGFLSIKGDLLKPLEYEWSYSAHNAATAAKIEEECVSVVWVEPGTTPDTTRLYINSEAVPKESLSKLGLSEMSELALPLRFSLLPTGGARGTDLIGSGTIFYGATEGPVFLGGRPRRFLNGARATRVLTDEKGRGVRIVRWSSPNVVIKDAMTRLFARQRSQDTIAALTDPPFLMLIDDRIPIKWRLEEGQERLWEAYTTSTTDGRTSQPDRIKITESFVLDPPCLAELSVLGNIPRDRQGLVNELDSSPEAAPNSIVEAIDVSIVISMRPSPFPCPISDRLQALMKKYALETIYGIMRTGTMFVKKENGVTIPLKDDWSMPFIFKADMIPVVRFRRGEIGIENKEIHVKEGTESLVGDNVYIYENRKWVLAGQR